MNERDLLMLSANDKFKRDVETCKWLADRAWSRFQSRRDVDWKVSFGVNGAMLAAAATIISVQDLNLSSWVLAVSLFPIVLTVGIYWLCWLPYVNRESLRDLATGYFWEQQVIERSRLTKLPNGLVPRRIEEMILNARIDRPRAESTSDNSICEAHSCCAKNSEGLKVPPVRCALWLAPMVCGLTFLGAILIKMACGQ